MISSNDNEYKFICTGSFSIDKKLEPTTDADGNVVGFILPDGREVRLVIALEIENGDNFDDYVVNEKEMAKIGFSCLDYEQLAFYDQAQRSM